MLYVKTFFGSNPSGMWRREDVQVIQAELGAEVGNPGEGLGSERWEGPYSHEVAEERAEALRAEADQQREQERAAETAERAAQEAEWEARRLEEELAR